MADRTSESSTAARHAPLHGYAGDVDPTRAWGVLKEEASAMLVDVRTIAEWSYVGLPDLSELGKQPLFVEWQVFPELAMNQQFTEIVTSAVPNTETPLVFLCRSGSRSGSAATAMAALGYSRCYNLADGFEGNPDSERHRGTLTGWKAAGLPWMQS